MNLCYFVTHTDHNVHYNNIFLMTSFAIWIRNTSGTRIELKCFSYKSSLTYLHQILITIIQPSGFVPQNQLVPFVLGALIEKNGKWRDTKLTSQTSQYLQTTTSLNLKTFIQFAIPPYLVHLFCKQMIKLYLYYQRLLHICEKGWPVWFAISWLLVI